MTAVMSPSTSSPATSPPAVAPTSSSAAATMASASSPSSSAVPTMQPHPALPPLITSPPTARRTTLSRPISLASRHRLSQYSAGSGPSRSRPASYMFPVFQSSLPYALVRDFAYPNMHPLHYGPQPEASAPQSATESQRRVSDPEVPQWENKMPWEGVWKADGDDVPVMQFADGPPWSEDEDLQSPVVSSRHRKNKSSSASLGGSRRTPRVDHDASAVADSKAHRQDRGSYYVSTARDGSKRYYLNDGAEANGPGGEYVTYPPSMDRYSVPSQATPQFTKTDYTSDSEESTQDPSPDYLQEDQSRYSRDYQFTITSPDEEMHGKAVALYDFEREDENELPLVEGQIIWVSYRHGQGWLVAKDPKTQENGLVPETYVRLLRDIEGGISSLAGLTKDGTASPNEAGTPTQAEHPGGGLPAVQSPTPGAVANGYHQPVVSTFSTSSKDLDPYPTNQLGIQAGQAPPQVVHYHGQRGGSQANTPTVGIHQDTGLLRRESQDGGRKRSDPHVVPVVKEVPESEKEKGQENMGPDR